MKLGRPRITPAQARDRLAPLADGVTVQELAARLGVSKSTLYYWMERAGVRRAAILYRPTPSPQEG